MISRQRCRRHPRAAVGLALAAALVGLLTGVAGPARAADPAGVAPAGVAKGSTATRAATPQLAWHGPRSERVVALTFDDGWNARALRRIYRVLLRERVPATFFVTGVYVQRAPALWRSIAAAGFPLASHSYLHRDARRMTPRQLAADLARTRQAVEAATGRPMLGAYRPPYGSRNRTTDRLAAAAGFPAVVMWDVTGGDATGRPTLASVVRGASSGRPGSIVLLHAGPAVTPRALPAIIARYRARGFRFVTIDELLGLPPPGSEAPMTATPPRDLDRLGPGGGHVPAPAGAPPGQRAAAGGGRAVPPRARVAPPPAGRDAVASRPKPESPPAARDASWARRDDTRVGVGLFSVALLGLLLVLGAAAGRAGAAGSAAPGDGRAMPDGGRSEPDDAPV